ncbi:filamentous hemagglutinin N-terminal domain-containing protein [Pelatocladus sp. BLCC-F211]|uniref:two-partner secretion domain-containing protein n=1 Tax=Pelatocladus sp. BLCC-F211 TaxID=3342752 RepID=UPI0035B7C047
MRSLFFLILSLVTWGYLAPIHKAIAQLTPDTSLGGESSIVNPNVVDGIDRIDRGAIRNSNLFHSFQDFNVDAGRGVYFSNPAGITNILTRVTGGNRSNILGTLGVLGNANLFLINPRGISFGPNASLDLRGGSFFGTTGDSVLFDNFEFSASNPQPVPQLTINIPIGLRFRDNPGNITNNVNTLGFGVQSGKTLALVGGNVSLDGGIVYAPGAKVELGGLSQAGTVGLNPDGSLSFPSGVAKADVSLQNLATVYVVGGGGGSINVNARNLDISGGGDIVAGIESGLGTPSAQAGDIVVNASGGVKIEGDSNFSSRIRNIVFPSGQGNAGNVIINANSLEGTGRFVIGSFSFGGGNAGKVTITATDKVSLQGLEGEGSGIGSSVDPFSTGSANDIEINTRSLSLSNFAGLATSTAGQGNAGNIRIKASESVSVSGDSILQAATYASGNAGKIIIDAPNANVSFDNSSVTTSVFGNSNIFGVDLVGTGQGGDIDITARSLSLDNGSQLFTNTSGSTGEKGPPNAGNINLNISESLNVRGTSRLRSQTEGEGKAGNIQVKTGSLLLTQGSQLNSSTYGKGDAGFININVIKDAIFDGVASNGQPSGVASEAVDPGEGNGGTIEISANNLFLKNGARISTSTFGRGNAGTIKITARDTLSVDGVGSNNVSTQIASRVQGSESTGNRKGGDISINAGSLSLTNGGQILANTSSKGDAGFININVTKDAILDGVGSNQLPSAIASEVDTNGNGNGGSIDLSANNIFLKNGARISASTFGQGNAGAIKINARDTLSIDGVGSNNFSTAISSFVSGVVPESAVNRKGGNISINAGSLSLTNGGQIIASTFSKGDAGNITINIIKDAILDGVGTNRDPSAIASEVDTNGNGNGGSIDLSANNLFLKNGARISASTFGQGNAGAIKINARDTLSIDGVGSNNFSTAISSLVGGIVPESAGDRKGGNISINAGSLFVTNRALINNSTSGKGDAGDISIQVDGSIKLTNSSQIRSNVEAGGEGLGGDIQIDAKSLTLTNGSEIGAVVFREANGLQPGKGKSGNIVINATDFTDISGIGSTGFSSGIFTSAERGTTATQPQAAGNITITTGNFRIADGAVVDASTSNDGSGGSITIKAKNFTATGGGQVLTTARGNGDAGNITLKVADNLTISGSDPNFNQRIEQAKKFAAPNDTIDDIVNNQGAQSGIFANTAPGSTGKGGSIFIDPKQVTVKDGGIISATSSGTGEAGNIQLKAGNLTLDRGTITAESGSATGGNITLDIKDVLLLRRNSLISATAGRNQGAGNGGNININTGLLVALPQENSDIRADAFKGNGGNINIQADAVFGIQPRQFSTPLSDITASSESGISGNVNLNTLDIDPTQGLSELPENTTDPSSQIAQNPCQKGSGSAFIVTGRGGIPSSPSDSFNSDNVRVDLLQPITNNNNPQNLTNNPPKIQTATKEIIPAQGWIFNEKGEVVLTAYDPTTSSPQRSSKATASCPAPF